MGLKRSLVVMVYDDGYGDQLVKHLNDAINGRDMRAETVLDKDLLGAAKQAYAALVGAHARDDSVQGAARLRLGKALGYLKSPEPAANCDECSEKATRQRIDAAGLVHYFCEKHWSDHQIMNAAFGSNNSGDGR